MLSVDSPGFDTLRTLAKTWSASEVRLPVVVDRDVFDELASPALQKCLVDVGTLQGRRQTLRPDFTILVGRDYVNSVHAGRSVFTYEGPIFRLLSHPTQGRYIEEQQHFGIEDIGCESRVEADVLCIRRAREALSVCGISDCRLELSDLALPVALIGIADLPSMARRRLMRSLGSPAFNAVLQELLNVDTTGNPTPLTGSIDALGREQVRVLLDEVIELATPSFQSIRRSQMADRLLEKAELASWNRDPQKGLAHLEKSVQIDGSLVDAEIQMMEVFQAAGCPDNEALDAFRARNAALRTAGFDPREIRYRSAFVGRLDYYSGLVFQMLERDRIGPSACKGGRYDPLFEHLGAKRPLPAVGFTIWLDRCDSKEIA